VASVKLTNERARLPVCVCGVSLPAIAISEFGLATVDNASVGESVQKLGR